MTESARYVMKIRLAAVIPTVQYGNIQPEFEVESDDPFIAMGTLEEYIQLLWVKYGEKPLNLKSGSTKRIKAFVGGEVDYDEVNHVYSWNGEIYESGSQYAKKFEKPFDRDNISQAMAKKYNVKPEDILEMWELKARTSREFGTALHSSLELYGKYNGLAKALERDSAMHDHPVIKTAVEGFYKGRENEVAEYEVFVVDHKAKRAGQIDRLLMTEKNCQVQDFKCNAVLTPDKVRVYWEQLKFYSEILRAAGWKTDPERIFHYNGVWKEYKAEGNDAN